MSDVDKRVFPPAGVNASERSRRFFNHKGVTVEERVYNWGGYMKLAWARETMETLYIPSEEKRNPIVHKDYSDPDDEAYAREVVTRAFEDYWGIDKAKLY